MTSIASPPPHSARQQAKASDLDCVLDALTYADIFDYPLTAEEVFRSVSFLSISLEEVHLALEVLTKEQSRLERTGSLFFRKGRRNLAEIRSRRSTYAARMWLRARFYAGLIALLPFVRMVAVTGALAMDNVEDGADIDYLIVVESGKVWTTRGMIILIGKIARRFGDVICPNYIISTKALEFGDRNLYTAHELVQMVPLYGLEIVEQIFDANLWVENYLPNALPCRPKAGVAATSSPLYVMKSAGELLLRTAIGNALEEWERHRKIRKLTSGIVGDSTEVHFGADVCKGHRDGHGARIMEAWTRSRHD